MIAMVSDVVDRVTHGSPWADMSLWGSRLSRELRCSQRREEFQIGSWGVWQLPKPHWSLDLNHICASISTHTCTHTRTHIHTHTHTHIYTPTNTPTLAWWKVLICVGQSGSAWPRSHRLWTQASFLNFCLNKSKIGKTFYIQHGFSYLNELNVTWEALSIGYRCKP